MLGINGGIVVMVFNSTFNNISVISLCSVLLMEETGDNNDLLQVADKFYHIMYIVHIAMSGIRTYVVICTDLIGSCKSNYHAITTTTAP